MKTNYHYYPLLFLTLLLLLLPLHKANAQYKVHPGIRTGVYSGAGDIFIGGDILAPLGHSWDIDPNIEYIFARGMTYATFNIDFAYMIPSELRGVDFWAGAGPAFVYTNVNGPPPGNTRLGVNLLGGIGFHTGSVIPYIQPKIIIKNNSEFVLGFGVRF